MQTIVRVSTEEGMGAVISKAPNWFSSDRGGTLGLDWGDFDRDGDLDLALASSVGATIYRNDNGVLRRLWSNTPHLWRALGRFHRRWTAGSGGRGRSVGDRGRELHLQHRRQHRPGDTALHVYGATGARRRR
ncbi:MAG: VCBS repeat-containing protein [Caldilineaceae bacterium]